jgi:hypothetical protein
MGGYGSGRPGRYATVEGCRTLKLDVNRITRGIRDNLRGLQDGQRIAASFAWNWTSRGAAAPWASVLLTLTLDPWRGHARLQFDVDHASRRTGPQDQTIQMETSPCPYGGRRWWWVCPETWRRCGALYLPNGGTRFLSRGPGAYPLKYASQNGGPIERSHGRLARLHRKLGGVYDGMDCPLPARPKGMRHATYDRLAADWEAQLERHDDIWLARTERLLGRMSGRT